MQPKVSVIIPNYNHAEFLEQRLRSVLDQTYGNIEVILMDDASTDGSRDILKEYEGHPKVKHIEYNTNNSGSPFLQWQKGLSMASGDYIWIAESDDYCEFDFLETIMALFKEETVLAYCASNVVDAEGKILGKHKWPDALDKERWKHPFTNDGHNEITQYLRYRNTIANASAVVIKKTALDKVDLPIDMRFCGDWQLWIQIVCLGSVAYTPKALNYFRRHQQTTRTVQNIETEQQRYHEYFNIIKNNSTLLSRLLHLKKYDWMLREWQGRQHHYDNAAYKKLNMPFELLMRYKYKFR
ncbi:MAG: glycosyltransferase [Bacteroidota bacterium]